METAQGSDRQQPWSAVLHRLVLGGGCLLTILGVAGLAAADRGPAAEAFARGVAAAQAGRSEEAIQAWSLAQQRATAAGDTTVQMEALLRRAEAYQVLGLLDRAATDLEDCRELARRVADPQRQAMAAGMLGFLELTRGRSDQAEDSLHESLALAEAHHLPAVQAATLAHLGLLMIVRHDPPRALDYLARSLTIANQIGDPALLAIVQINQARAALAADPPRSAVATSALDSAVAMLDRLAPTRQKAQLRMTWAVSLLELLDQQGVTRRPDPSRLRPLYDGLREAQDLAQQFNDRRTLSFAYGHLGRLSQTQQRYAEALDLTGEAIRLAQQTGNADLLYQWFWQTGRLYRTTGQINRAIKAYSQAVEALHQIPFTASQTPDALGRSLRDTVRPLYREAVDLLLQRAAWVNASRQQVQQDLGKARDIMEQFKKTELEIYYGDPCLEKIRSKVVIIGQLLKEHPEHTAVLYPIILLDRTALIVTIGNTHQLFTIAIGKDEMARQVKAFRNSLEQPEDRSSEQYLAPAQRLYTLLIRPLERKLAEYAITTLVFAPDETLYTVPLAALHDGQRFLVERYASAVVPGLTQLDPQQLSHEQIRVLIAALTGRQYVQEEVETIKSLLSPTNVDILEGQNFAIDHLRAALAHYPYSIVHIASHSEFNESFQDSFLETSRGQLTMGELGNLIWLDYVRGAPVHLLILSACETASGSDRAALGLSGIAIKAGAGSALGSLWSIQGEAAAKLMREFYLKLQEEGVSKAEALRQAQLRLIHDVHDTRYRHPFYWSAFLLIGNWL